VLDSFDDELDVVGLDGLPACVSSERCGLFADAHGIFFQDMAHFFDCIVPHSFSTGFLDQSPNGRRRKFTVSHQNNQKRVWNCGFY